MSAERYDFLTCQFKSLSDCEAVLLALKDFKLELLTEDVINTLRNLLLHPSEIYTIRCISEYLPKDPVISFLTHLHDIPDVDALIQGISYIHSFNNRLPVLKKAFSTYSQFLQKLKGNEAIAQIMGVVLKTVNYQRQRTGLDCINWIPISYLASLSNADEGTEEYVLMKAIASSIHKNYPQALESLVLEDEIAHLDPFDTVLHEVSGYSEQFSIFLAEFPQTIMKYFAKIDEDISSLYSSVVEACQAYSELLQFFSEDEKDYSPDSLVSIFDKFYSKILNLTGDYSACEEISQDAPYPNCNLVEEESTDGSNDSNLNSE